MNEIISTLGCAASDLTGKAFEAYKCSVSNQYESNTNLLNCCYSIFTNHDTVDQTISMTDTSGYETVINHIINSKDLTEAEKVELCLLVNTRKDISISNQKLDNADLALRNTVITLGAVALFSFIFKR
ncbi:hypothetical protein [Ruminococcus sp. HUN007]|uniref:hypothetical protein n=1 Tax=Ruminococcus sp. HUN007 TaxID=1514668 RepID=UPI0005D1CE01|nr:hypothetical protein [Ruminococcus sp. HUN007]